MIQEIDRESRWLVSLIQRCVFRCSLEDGAVLKSKADAAGMTLSAYVGKLVREHIGEVTLTEVEQAWIKTHYEANLARRARADHMTAAGYFKRKRRGRPRKPGPRKGTKRVKTL